MDTPKTKSTIINKPNKITWGERSIISYFLGIILGFLSIFIFYTFFTKGFSVENFLSLFLPAIVLGAIAFILFSPWIRLNFLISGILTLAAGVWMLVSLFNFHYDDFWLSFIWTITLLLIGLSLFLRFFNTTLFKSLHKISQTKTVRLIAKVLFWGAVAIICLLVFGGLLSFVAGLSATTIIIILLILILLK